MKRPAETRGMPEADQHEANGDPQVTAGTGALDFIGACIGCIAGSYQSDITVIETDAGVNGVPTSGEETLSVRCGRARPCRPNGPPAFVKRCAIAPKRAYDAQTRGSSRGRGTSTLDQLDRGGCHGTHDASSRCWLRHSAGATGRGLSAALVAQPWLVGSEACCRAEPWLRLWVAAFRRGAVGGGLAVYVSGAGAGRWLSAGGAFVAIVFYALSQQIERGQKIDGGAAVFAWRRNFGSMRCGVWCLRWR